MSRYARGKDASHRAVVAAFKALGCSVLVIDCSAADAWDLEVGFAGRDHGVEVKPEHVKGRAYSNTMPRESQALFFAKWRGAQIQVVRNVDDAAALVLLWRGEQVAEHRAAQALARERAA